MSSAAVAIVLAIVIPSTFAIIAVSFHISDGGYEREDGLSYDEHGFRADVRTPELDHAERLFDRMHLGDAYPHYEEALKDDPDDPDVLNNAALVLKYLGRNEESLALLEKALVADPTHTAALANMVSLLYEEERYEEALKLVELGDDGEYVITKFKALILSALGEHEESLRWYDTTLVLMEEVGADKSKDGPKIRADVLANKALALHELGREKVAERYVELALGEDRRNELAWEIHEKLQEKDEDDS